MVSAVLTYVPRTRNVLVATSYTDTTVATGTDDYYSSHWTEQSTTVTDTRGPSSYDIRTARYYDVYITYCHEQEEEDEDTPKRKQRPFYEDIGKLKDMRFCNFLDKNLKFGYHNVYSGVRKIPFKRRSENYVAERRSRQRS